MIANLREREGGIEDGRCVPSARDQRSATILQMEGDQGGVEVVPSGDRAVMRRGGDATPRERT